MPKNRKLNFQDPRDTPPIATSREQRIFWLSRRKAAGVTYPSQFLSEQDGAAIFLQVATGLTVDVKACKDMANRQAITV